MSQALLHSGVYEAYLTLFVALFKRMFRVDKETFSELLDCIVPFMQQKNLTKARNSSGSPIVLKARLAVTLRWLAGASYLDLCFAFGIAPSTFYHPAGVLWPTLEAIDAAFTIGFAFDDIKRLETLSKGFYDHSGGVLDGCVLALDGLESQLGNHTSGRYSSIKTLASGKEASPS